jgi:FkbM family methyltransferase
MYEWLYRAQNWLRWHGLEIGRANPDTSIPFFVAMLCDHLQINCVFDVGAHVGQFARALRHHGYRGRIVSFEPVPSAYNMLERYAERDEAWWTQQLALGAQEQRLPMQMHGDTATTSSFRAATLYGRQNLPSMRNVQVEDVIVTRLDAVFAKYTESIGEPRVYLKLDTQGWDLEVLKGATGCLHHIQALQSEMSVKPLYEGTSDYTVSIGAIRSLGFEISTILPVFRDSRLQLAEFDCVMVRPES